MYTHHTVQQTALSGGSLWYSVWYVLPDDVRKETHESCVLDGTRKLSLRTGGKLGVLAAYDTPVRIHVAPQRLYVFVIEVLDLWKVLFVSFIHTFGVLLVLYGRPERVHQLERNVVGVYLLVRILDGVALGRRRGLLRVSATRTIALPPVSELDPVGEYFGAVALLAVLLP